LEPVQPEHGHGGQHGGPERQRHRDAGAGDALEARPLDQEDAEDAAAGGGPDRQAGADAEQRPGEQGGPDGEGVGEGEHLGGAQAGQREEGAEQAEAAGAAPQPEDAGLPEDESGAAGDGEGGGEEEGERAAGEGDDSPVTVELAELVGELAHPGEGEATAEHPGVGGEATTASRSVLVHGSFFPSTDVDVLTYH